MIINIENRFNEIDRDQIGKLAFDAYHAKLKWICSSNNDFTLNLLKEALNPETTLVARDETGKIVGYCAFETTQQFPVSEGLKRALKNIPLWRQIFLSFFEHKCKKGEFYISMIVADANVRGQGIGSKLLHEAYEVAKGMGCEYASLNVIYENASAKKLYNREGFVDTKKINLCCCLPYFYNHTLTGADFLVKNLSLNEKEISKSSI